MKTPDEIKKGLECCKNFNGDFTKDTCRFCGTKASFGNFEWRGVKED